MSSLKKVSIDKIPHPCYTESNIRSLFKGFVGQHAVGSLRKSADYYACI
jgi:hypothetical protein